MALPIPSSPAKAGVLMRMTPRFHTCLSLRSKTGHQLISDSSSMVVVVSQWLCCEDHSWWLRYQINVSLSYRNHSVTILSMHS